MVVRSLKKKTEMKINKGILLAVVMLNLLACQQQSRQGIASGGDQDKTSEILLPGSSIYNLNRSWTDENNQPVHLKQFAGKPAIISMIFTHCGYACPMLVQDIKHIVAEFDQEKKLPFEIILISFDHIRDTPERLKEYAESQELNEDWHLLHGNPEQIREIAVALGISFEMSEDGDIDHSNKKLLLDKQGVVSYAQSGLMTPVNDFSAQINMLK